MSRSFRIPSSPSANPRLTSASLFTTSGRGSEVRPGTSGITALNIEFVAKPDAAHRVHAALPGAITGALGEVAGFAGAFVLIANYEARLVTVVTLWTGENRMQHCQENLKWVRALLTPYMDRCLRVQTQAAYVPNAGPASQAAADFGAQDEGFVHAEHEAAAIVAA